MQIPDELLNKLAMMGPPPNMEQMAGMGIMQPRARPQFGGMLMGQTPQMPPMPGMMNALPQSRQGYQMNAGYGDALMGR